MKTGSWSCGFFGIALSAVLLAPAPLNAASYNWTNIAGGRFDGGGNWNPAGSPGTNDFALFLNNRPARYTVTFSGDSSVTNKTKGLQFKNDKVEFDIGDSGGVASYDAGNFLYAINDNDDYGDLLISRGAFVCGQVYGGDGYGTLARIALTGTNTTWTVKDYFMLNGNRGECYLTVSNGARLTASASNGGYNLRYPSTPYDCHAISMGDSSDTQIGGVLVVTGTNSSVTLTNATTYFRGRNARFYLLDKATATFDALYCEGGAGTQLRVDDASLSVKALSLKTVAAQFKNSTITCTGDLIIDLYGASPCSCTVDASVVTASGNFTVGDAGTATLIITNGGVLSLTKTTPTVSFPNNQTANARIEITGPNSRLSIARIRVGGGFSSMTGKKSAVMRVADGGLLVQRGNSANDLAVLTTGTLILDLGTVSNGATVVVQGLLLGSGTIVNSVDMNYATATNRPGNALAAGVLGIGGSYTQSLGVLELDIGGTTPGSGYDVLSVTNRVVISGGAIKIAALSGFKPSSGVSTYDVVTGSSISTNGATITLPPAADGVKWSAAVVTLAGGRTAFRVSSEVRSRGTLLMVR